MNIGTLLSGGECVGVGAREAGLTHLWGFEIEDDIAQVARSNGFNVITADVMELDPTSLEVPDVLHASPVCKRASIANQNAELNEDGTKEAPEDIAMGEKIAQFIDVMTPQVFTLENVYAYRNFKAFKIICNALNRNGYMWDFDNLNAADYGVPQTRRRLILRAIRGALLPNLPQPEKWVGWYEAIEDLIPTLLESKFAPWQLERLPDEIKENVLCDMFNASRDFTVNSVDKPSFTVTSTMFRRPITVPKAWLVGVQGQGGDLIYEATEPSQTISANHSSNKYRAWLIGSENAGQEWGGTRFDNQPAMTLTQEQKPRAWLSHGRVVSMSVRALARFQSIPDSYILPEIKVLACRVIGNGVPPLLYQKIIQPLTGT